MPRQQQVDLLPAAIKEWRRERGLSQSELAREAKCSEGLIAQIETGRRQPGIVNAQNIAKALGVSLYALGRVFVDADELHDSMPEAS